MAQPVKDLILSPQWLRSLLWLEFDPWPRNFPMPWVWPKQQQQQQKPEGNDIGQHLNSFFLFVFCLFTFS